MGATSSACLSTGTHNVTPAPVPETQYVAMELDRAAPPLVKQRSSTVVMEVTKWVSPKMVDSIIAALGLMLGALFLHSIDLAMGANALPLFAAPILPSSVIFFGGPTTPPLKGFALSSLGAWLTGFAIRFSTLDHGTELCVAIGVLLMFFRLTGVFFVPTVGLAVFLSADTTGIMSQPLPALRWFLTPWLTGSLFMYGAAYAVAALRRRVRSNISKAKFKATLLKEAVEHGDDALKEIFKRYDTSGDGFLQAGELRYAWQVVTGEEMTEEEAQALVESVDTDGNNEIDPDEFVALVRENFA